ncbi:pseudaminic acid biosynthesis protein PseG [Pseudoalteromonas sp. S4488]|uniref:pseudaminic acid biosynthesis protein PseG n=1 Tax=unclassified Pseudoalteromonas TaxID=194690 RepID=UPI00110908A5|nr:MULTISPECIES: pseudaminic acid biosynthesis protein PseG [unclassified Pseudoalteromonas]TMO32598.1 pseudaminic acid biosynthesis protein PseG [Pseudoalteromonas sp. S4491]TMO37285.1 pseudaminic acid biosynthesis protein PseG [Pseudoalteromonas sp. S4488]
MIAIRVDTLCGLGHFMRCKWLALELQCLDEEVVLLVDTQLSDHLTKELRNIHLLPYAKTQIEDAANCVQLFNEQQLIIDKLLVDSYRFDIEWESEMAKYVPSIIAVDDLERDHLAELVIDSKWNAEKTSSRYQSTALESQHFLLGPDFSMLSRAYRNCVQTERSNKELMFSLGGGGDWKELTEIIRLILETAPEYKVNLIIGPNATSVTQLHELALGYSQLNLIEAPSCLANYYKSCTLFVGALGTSLYELAATKTSALTFSIAKNQENQQTALDDLGHYFHIANLIDYPPEKVLKLILAMLQNIERIHLMRENVAVNIDGEGASRVAKLITSKLASSQITQANSNLIESQHQHLTDTITLRRVVDQDINRYLAARNLPNNAWRMTITKDIDQLDHYCWWFANRRDSYVMEVKGKPLLYVWHQLYEIEQQNYLIGGWFAASDDVNFAHAQLVLDWQLKESEQTYPDAMWVAVINKENKFVNLLNQRAGFKSIAGDAKKMAVTQHLFPNASIDDFNFVGKG